MSRAAPAHRLPRLLRARAPVALIALIGAGVSWHVEGVVGAASTAEQRHALRQAARERVFAVRGELRRAVERPEPLGAFIAASGEPDPEGFALFASSLMDGGSPATSMAYVQALPEGEVRLRFAVPGGRGEPAPGDEAGRSEARLAARDAGRPRASGPLGPARDGALGFEVYVPVYEGVPDGVDERRAALRGFAVARIDAGRVLEAAQGAFRSEDQGFGVELVDLGAPGQVTLARAGEALSDEVEALAEGRIDLGGRAWLVRAYGPAPGGSGGGALGFGLALTALLTAYAQLLVTGRARVEAEVEARTRDLAEAAARARADAERLARLNEALAGRSRELDEFLWVATHDLQEPSRRVGLFAQLLDRALPAEGAEAARRHVEGLKRASERLQVRLKALHALSEVARGDVEGVRVRVGDCVDGALRALADRVEGRGARVERGELPEVLGDPRLIRRVYEELIDNALRHGGEAPVVRLTAERQGARWLLGVQDEGPGIDPSRAEEAFKPFVRLGEPADDRAGIGLTIVRRAVGRMGGEVQVEAVAGGGAHLRFALPAVGEAAPMV